MVMKLPVNFHGNIKPRLRLSSLNEAKVKQRGILEEAPTSKVTTWQRKRFDKDVVADRR